MKLLTTGKPEAAADKTRDARPALQNAYLSVANKALYAATPYLGVRLPVEIDEGDTDGPITKDALVAARKRKTDKILANGQLTIHGHDGSSVTLPRPDNGSFPNIEGVLPTDEDYGADAFHVALNPDQLVAIADAMGASTVRLTFHKKTPALAAILVEPITFTDYMPDVAVKDRIVGALMPVRAVNDTPHLIRYVYPGSVAHGQEPMRPVGKVYVRSVFDDPPDRARTFSYTKEAAKATRWPTREAAERAIAQHGWNDAAAVAASTAADLTRTEDRS